MDKSETPRTDAQLSGIDSFGHIPTMEDRFQRMCRHARTLERELAALTAQLAEARRDAERLDFAQSKSASIYHSMERTHWVFVNEKRSASSRKGILGETLRGAIDAAMKEPK